MESLERVKEIARAVRAAGGRALIVGGYVRDLELGIESKDLDVEVLGLELPELERVLSSFGEVIQIGRAFGVLRVKGLDVDVSLPRRDSKVGPGHRGFDVEVDPQLSFAEAARRRDLTMNSMGLDPLTGERLDPYDGRGDLKRGVLRATDRGTFSEDPLRGMRVAQLAARFEMPPDDELLKLCEALDLSELPGERVLAELEKLLLKGVKPSIGCEVLRETGMLQSLPEFAALVGVPQDPEWHPEGDVWVHTLMVLDEAAALRDGGADDAALMFGALCHDFGKPAATFTDEAGRVRSPGHEIGGLEPTASFFERLRAGGALAERVAALVQFHLAPILFVTQGAGDKAYRKLARKLSEADVSFELLLRVATADHFGRTTPEALAREFPEARLFLGRTAELSVQDSSPPDVVQGRHLMARGMQPGPEFGPILERCRELQDETGWDDPERILARVLDARA